MAFEEIQFPLTAAGVRFLPGQRAVYKPNHRSFGAFMKSEQIRDATAEVARDIAIAAAVLTPAEKVGAEEHTGLHAEVKAGYRVEREAGFEKIGRNIRVRVDVVNDVEGSAIVEFGGKGMEAQRNLGSAGAAFGDFHTWREDD